ncbi:3-keto-5-aminohexanoate cleavage protein [Clostridiales bacterium PH28_bin88]|nr:3-keto-5-aminohexanoate cleavage protein [Clostridiales bacterium PH28_bin88]
MEKLIITVAPVGAEVTRQDTPYLPLTPDEIAEEAFRCARAGASILHLHVRDREGKPTQSREVFKEVISRVKEKTDMIVQVSTGGAVGMTPAERLQSIYSHEAVEMATLTCGTVNFGSDVFMNTPPDIEEFAKAITEKRIKPEIECFEAGMINNALMLLKKGLVKEPLHFDFVMGVPGGIMARPRDLIYLSENIPSGSTWTVAGIGRYELSLGVMAILLGGHVRVGFEDNIYYTKGVLAKNNAQLVERISRLAAELGRDVANPDEARKILGLIY